MTMLTTHFAKYTNYWASERQGQFNRINYALQHLCN